MKHRIPSRLGLAALLLAAGGAFAQAGTDAILVFDASGSMWGQIDGVNKIVIARDVVSNLLDELPDNRRLGLMAYGHNRKGDCGDIQMLAPVGADRETIRSAVLGLNPKGMTPMTAAVQLAAEELKFTENKATVILVSDGEETCHADPCQAVAALDQLGVDLTVHTVGFGLESAEAKNARAQLQCMAEATGGQFFTADNAQELAEALATVAAAPATTGVTLQATDGAGGAPIASGLRWTVRDGSTGEVLHQGDKAGSLTLDLEPGLKDVQVERLSDGAVAESAFDPAEQDSLSLVLAAAPTPAPAEPAAPPTLPITLQATDQKGGPVIDSGLTWTVLDGGTGEVLHEATDAGVLALELTAGIKDVRVQRAADGATAEGSFNPADGDRYTLPIVVEYDAAVSAPDTAAAGSTIRVSWEGPDQKNDYISVEVPDKESGYHSYITYTRTAKGSPLELKMPPAAGSYEIRYIQDQGKKTLARHTIEVTAVEASVEAPATAAAGSTVRVNWTGPNYESDYISTEAPDKESGYHSYYTYTYTAKGSPLELQMPPAAGTYEIRYIQDQGKKTLARHTIEVTAVEASVEAPATAAAGSTVRVNWTGPNYESDYISTEAPDKESGYHSYYTYTYTAKGSPLELQMPPDAGTYEIRYIQDQDKKTLARQTIEVTAVEASVEAPTTAAAGSTVRVNWTGPNYESDYISTEAPDKESGYHSYYTYTYTAKGSPLELKMPEDPGSYEIRYIQDQGKKTLARQSITVTPAP